MDDRDIMKLALEALQGVYWSSRSVRHDEAITALRERLAQPEQEPVAWGVFDGPNLHDMFFTEQDAQDMARLKGDGSTVKPLYTTPPQRTWVGLTDEEVKYFVSKLWPVGAGAGKLFRAIEAKLKEKNT